MVQNLGEYVENFTRCKAIPLIPCLASSCLRSTNVQHCTVLMAHWRYITYFVFNMCIYNIELHLFIWLKLSPTHLNCPYTKIQNILFYFSILSMHLLPRMNVNNKTNHPISRFFSFAVHSINGPMYHIGSTYNSFSILYFMKIITLFIVDCPIGTHSDQNECKLCDYGTYQDEIGQESCKSCGHPNTTDIRGATARTDCKFSKLVL